MVVTFVSNYINHHQIPFCEAMNKTEGIEFHFIQTMQMEEERVKMGWGIDTRSLSYVTLFYEEEAKCISLINNSDVVIFGWGHDIALEQKRLESGKLTFKLSERIYREGQWKAISPKGLLNKYKEHIRYRKKPVYLLCAGAYVASDFELIKSYPGKKLKWGYFTNCKHFDGISALQMKGQDKLVITWAGRFIKLKHPEFAVKLAAKLKKLGVNFEMNLIGDGNMMPELQAEIKKSGLEEKVRLCGFMKPKDVRAVMEKSHVYLFTSNFIEGWGAVVPEAMNSKCAVIASNEAGAVPYLIEDGINGLSYSDGNYREFEKKALGAILTDTLNPDISKGREKQINYDRLFGLGEKAYETIVNTWNAEIAASRFVRLCTSLLRNGEETIPINGPLSRAENLKPPGIKRYMQDKSRLE